MIFIACDNMPANYNNVLIEFKELELMWMHGEFFQEYDDEMCQNDISPIIEEGIKSLHD